MYSNWNYWERIVVFTKKDEKVECELEKLRIWLKNSYYPDAIIERGIKNAQLQGPANDPKLKKSVIPLVSSNCTNYSSKGIVKQAKLLLKNCPDSTTREIFENKEIVLALKQPKSILRELSKARFDTTNIQVENGIFHCKDTRCKICEKYLVKCKEFTMTSGTKWIVPSYIDCNSKNVIYYQLCEFCKKVSNIGKTNCLRDRTNGHISSCRLGNSSDVFDNHVYNCKTNDIGPYFKLWILMEVNDTNKLLVYENYFHTKGNDTINKYKAKGKFKI